MVTSHKMITRVELDAYVLDEDQPTVCPKCGSRTDFVVVDCRQIHQCLKCSYVFAAYEDTIHETL